MSKTNELLKEFEELCKFVREVHSDDTVCGYCEYDCGTVGEEPMECPGFESNECFVLKESLRKQYEMYEQVIRCKDCRYYRDGDCWHEWDNDGRMYYQSVINEPNPDDYCSRAERKEE